MRKVISFFALVALLLSIQQNDAVGELGAVSSSVESGEIYWLQNMETGDFLGVENNGSNTGAIVSVTDSLVNDFQKWQINIEKELDGNQWISLISIGSQLTLTGHLVQNGELYLTQELYSGTSDQLFLLEEDELDGTISLSMDGQNLGEAQWYVINTEEKVSHSQVMKYWAPNIYQDFNATYDFLWKYDYLTAFDFDGDWIGNNNWENSDSGSKVPYVYTSIQETSSHYFITYNFYHPRDVGNIGGSLLASDSHENDMEGALFVVRKTGSEYGDLEAVHAIQHSGYASYTGSEIEYGDNGRVDLFISSNGPLISGDGISQHGHCVHMWEGSNAEGGILYTYNELTDENGGLLEAIWNTSLDNQFVGYDYGLLSLDQLWDRRFQIGEGNTFNSYGNFDGDASSVSGMGSDSANAPWRWEGGVWMSDPAFLTDGALHYDSMSHRYTYNKYFSHKIVVNKIQAHVYKDPYNIFNKKTRKPDVFMRVTVEGTKFIDIGDWKVSNLDLNVWRDFAFGGDEAEDGRRFTEHLDTIYIAKPGNVSVYYEVRDRDSDADDTMGTLSRMAENGESDFFELGTDNGEATINGELHRRVE